MSVAQEWKRMSDLLTVQEQEKLKRLANYIAAGVTYAQAGSAVGISASRVSQMLNEDNNEISAVFFRGAVQQAQTERANSVFDTKEHIDQITLKALENVSQTVKWNMDPDLNLRVLSVMSKMPRAGITPHGDSARPLDGNGARTTLNLNIAFVNRVREGSVGPETVNGQVDSKEVDFLNPTAVEKLLTDSAPLGQSIESVRKMFDDLEVIPIPGKE